MSRTLAESRGYVPDARDDWYAQRRAARRERCARLRDAHYDRRCPLCGVGLGGFDRYVIPIARSGYAPSNTHHEVFAPRTRPVCLVACMSCLRLFRGELRDRYAQRNAARPSLLE